MLPEGAALTAGTEVEVRPVAAAPSPTDPTPEQVFKQQLGAAGVISLPSPAPTGVDSRERHLIHVEGTPLSQTIIEERR